MTDGISLKSKDKTEYSLVEATVLGAKRCQERLGCAGLVGGRGEVVGETARGQAGSNFWLDSRGSADGGHERA